MDSRDLRVDGDWMSIWKLKVPLRVKIFLWRACRECLPTRLQLQRRGIACSGLCFACDIGLENAWHILITCPLSIDYWKRAHLWDYISPLLTSTSSLKELCFQVLATLNHISKAKFAMILWSIWRARKEKLWDGVCLTAAQIIHRAGTFFGDWIHS